MVVFVNVLVNVYWCWLSSGSAQCAQELAVEVRWGALPSSWRLRSGGEHLRLRSGGEPSGAGGGAAAEAEEGSWHKKHKF